MQVSALSREEIFSILQTGENGLDSGETVRRLARYGPNELEARRRKKPSSLIFWPRCRCRQCSLPPSSIE